MFIQQVPYAIISLILLLCSCSSEKTDSETTQWGISPTVEVPDDRGAASDSSASCEDHLVAGEPLGIVAVPAEFQDTYGKLFCKYTEVVAPNGRPIRLFAQDEITHDQVVYARQVLKFYIEDVPGSRYGSDKTALANRIADSGETLLLLNGHDGEFPVFSNEDWEHISGCALYHDEIAAPGSDWYINNRYEGHRDATFEEILHLVHDFGIGVDVKGAMPGVLPEFQREIRAALINALEIKGLWAQGKEATDFIKNLREGGSLTQEYLAAVVDNYYGLWGAYEESAGGMDGGMWGFYVAKTRDEIPKKDPMGYALMEAFFNPWLTFEARIDASFDGVFSLAFDPKLPYTHKSQYLLRARLTGTLNSGLRGNDQDNVLRGNAGNNKLNGGGGEDTARFTGNAREYRIQRDESGLVVTDSVEGRDGVDRLVSIEWLEFADGRRSAAEFAGGQVKVLIIDGVNNHDWESTTRATKATLEQTGRFKVDVSTSPRKRAPKEEWSAWRPKFSDYQVVLSNFNDDCEKEDGCDTLWSAETQADFEKFVREGGGFVPVHAADNAFGNWPEYNKIIGIGGWGGRKAGKSGSLLRLINGKWQATSPNKGRSGDDEAVKDYLVIHDRPSHPILKGLPTEWMHAEDELYASLRGPVENIEVLAHSYCRQTRENEPMMIIITYGKGKIFHIPMGHWNDEFEPFGAALHCVGFQTVLARGTEYVATGKVTIGIPDSFPGKEKTSVVAPDKLKWPGRESTRDEPTQNRSRRRRRAFTKRVDVLGIRVLATADSSDEIVLHVANVLAEYLDNDEDGVPDNQKVMNALIRGKAAYRHSDDDEVHPNGAAKGLFDASLEEVLHLITDDGYGVAYPEVFGRVPGTEISNLLDKARGGRFMEVPEKYPDNAWFTYDDTTCDYDCQNSEYIYWVLTSILGAQDYPGRLEQIQREWILNTREKVKEGDPAAYALFTDPKYKFPTVLPEKREILVPKPSSPVAFIMKQDNSQHVFLILPGVTVLFGVLTPCPIFRAKLQTLKTNGTRHFAKNFMALSAGPIWMANISIRAKAM